MAPGDLIAPVGLSEGDLVQALDLDGFWYNAKVLQKRADVRVAEVLVEAERTNVALRARRRRHCAQAATG